MRRFGTIPVVFGCMTAVFTVTSFVAPQLTKAAGFDFWNYGTEELLLRAERGRTEDLDDSAQRNRMRSNAGDRLAARLIDAEVSLATACEELEELTRRILPGWFRATRQAHFHEARTEQQTVALYLLAGVRVLLRDDPSSQAEVLARVQLELPPLFAASSVEAPW